MYQNLIWYIRTPRQQRRGDDSRIDHISDYHWRSTNPYPSCCAWKAGIQASGLTKIDCLKYWPGPVSMEISRRPIPSLHGIIHGQINTYLLVKTWIRLVVVEWWNVVGVWKDSEWRLPEELANGLALWYMRSKGGIKNLEVFILNSQLYHIFI